MSVQRTVALPAAFYCPTWNNHQNKIMMIAKDESLWQMDYPALNHLEQLTKPIKELNSLIVSPDDTSIALVAGLDVYIVDTSGKP